jgi:RNA polymerase sigma-70 factor (ECF subfamily)
MSPSDEELMARLQRGEVRAFDLLYERYRGKLYNFILRLVQDPALAADLYQDTFVRVFQQAGRYCPRHRFSTWVYAIAHHLCVDCLRQRRPQVSLEQVAEALPAGDGGAGLERREQADRALRALGALPPEQRAAVLLRVVHGYSQQEAAQIAGVPEGTIKSRLHYALEKLRQVLEEG